MQLTTWQALITALAVLLGVWLPRFLPFFVFPPHKPTPRIVVYLGKALPFAITTMLVVYCLKDVQPLAWPYALPELLSLGLVALLYYTAKNSLVAMAGGTILYMFLVQAVFV